MKKKARLGCTYVPVLKYDLSRHYYDQLRLSVDAFTDMNLPVVPCMNATVSRDEYTGFTDYQDLINSGGLSNLYRENLELGLEGYEVEGRWIDDGKIFEGLFPTHISENGNKNFCCTSIALDAEAVHKQINLAQEFNFAREIAIQTNSTAH